MSTHKLPAGSVNFSVNMPNDLRQAAGRLAAMHDMATGRWISELIEARVHEARASGLIDHPGQMVLGVRFQH